MSNTLEIVRYLLEALLPYQILQKIGQREKTDVLDLFELLDGNYAKLEAEIEKLDKLALIEHVYTKNAEYYRISALGRRVLDILGMV